MNITTTLTPMAAVCRGERMAPAAAGGKNEQLALHLAGVP
jgi:hypothetical protein